MQLDTAALAEALIEARYQKRIRSQRAAAKLLGIANSTYARCEKGGTMPDLPTYLKLCAWLGTPAPYTINAEQMQALQDQLGIEL